MHAHSLWSGFRLPPSSCELWNFRERSSTAVSCFKFCFLLPLSNYHSESKLLPREAVRWLSVRRWRITWEQLRRLRQYCNFGRKQRNIQFCSELHVTSWGFRQPLLRAKEKIRRLDTSWRISEIGYGILLFRLLDAWNPGSWFLIRSDSFEKNCKLKAKENCQEKFGVSLESLTSD